jgi:hypothetical protein
MGELAHPLFDRQEVPMAIQSHFLRSRYESKEYFVIRLIGDHASAEVVEIIVKIF